MFWTRRKRTPPAIAGWTCLILILLLLAFKAVLLWALGRPLACAPCSLALWPESPAGQTSSRYLADWYSASHVIYGALVAWVLFRTSRHWPAGWLFIAAAFASVGWELVENTPWVIERFGADKAGPAYYGDSILNSVGDTAFVLAGFALARAIPVAATLALIVGLEVAAAFAIRDGLLLSTLMFILPVEAVGRWQAAL